ncbi:MAG TPA: hypothetical protein VJ521_07570, partial [Acidobacteriota bacterium]|nr:hypothetical protein [Acidobacteriota bacterium]
MVAEAWEAGEVLARFFFARLRLHSLSRFCISSCETESNFRTTASNFSASFVLFIFSVAFCTSEDILDIPFQPTSPCDIDLGP